MNKRTLSGAILSAIWILTVILLLIFKADNAKEMSLNEWGDFLAGIGSILALMWLVIGYFQQGQELKQNTNALLLQHEEMKQQIIATKELANQSKQQANALYELAYQKEREVEWSKINDT